MEPQVIQTQMELEWKSSFDNLFKGINISIEKEVSSKEEEYVASLERLEFSSNLTVARTQQKLRETNRAIQTANQNKSLYDAIKEHIRYYGEVFPNKHVIPLSTMIKICEKYGLVFAKSDLFIQEIPLKNLKEIEDFDETVRKKYGSSWNPFLYRELLDFQGEHKVVPSYSGYYNQKVTYYVSAPRSFFLEKKKDLIQTGAYLHTENFESTADIIETLKEERRIRRINLSFDPIVWAPVKFPLAGGACVLITKWGKEAEYPDFANPKEN